MKNGCLSLFGLPFAGAGVFMGWQLAGVLWLAAASQDWAETPAVLARVELERKDSSYRVLAAYDYEFAGEAYHSERVGLSDWSDNIGSHHKDLYRRLKKHKEAGEPVTCYVDPDDPAEALLDRKLRLVPTSTLATMTLLFGGVGFGLVASGPITAWRESRRQTKLALSPNEPWRVRDDWARGEIRSGGWTAVLVLSGFATFWNLISWSVAVGVSASDDEKEWWAWLLVGMFPAIGLGLIAAVGYLLVRRLRWGNSTFRMGAATGVIGGELTGVVLAPDGVRPEEGFLVELRCEQTQTRSSGGESETETVSLWEDQRRIGKTLRDPSGKQGIPVRFVIPSREKPTDPDADWPIAWKLVVDAKLPGIDYQAEFEVPVFVTADSRKGVERAIAPTTEYEVVEPLERVLARQGMRYASLGERGLRIEAPPGRNPGTAVFFFLMATLFLGVSIGMALWNDEWIRYLFVPVFGLAGGGILVGAVLTLLSASDLHVEGDQWRLKSGYYGFRGAGVRFTSGDIKRMSVQQTMTSNSGGQTTRWNNLTAKLRDGRSVTLVRGLKDRNAEGRLLVELRRLAEVTGRVESDPANHHS